MNLSEKNDAGLFDSHFAHFFRGGGFSVSESELAEHFYWLSPNELSKRLNVIVASGKVVNVGSHYSFSVFVKTLNKLYAMFRTVNVTKGPEREYSKTKLLSELVGVVHVVASERNEVVADLLSATGQGRTFLIAQERKALRPYTYSVNVVTKTFSDLFTNQGQIEFIQSITPGDRIVVMDGNFMTVFLLYICMAAITQVSTINQVPLVVLHNDNYDAGVFAGGFLRALYADLEIPMYRYSLLARQNPHLLREFVDGSEYFQFAVLNEVEGDSEIYLSLFKTLDKASLSIVSDMVYLSTVESGRFSVRHIKWVMGQVLSFKGIEVIESGDALYFVGERVRSKVDAVSINYADEYQIVSFDSFKGLVLIRSIQDGSEKHVDLSSLQLYDSASFIHVSDIAHQYYDNGILFMPLAGLHGVDDMDLFRFISCFQGARFIFSQKVYLAHALSNRGARLQSVYKSFID